MKRKYIVLLVVLSAVLLIVCVCSCCLLLSLADNPLQFEPDSLPNAQLGADYETNIRITKNSTPVLNVSITEGSLPPGLELTKVKDEDAASISGIPEEAGTFTFTIRVGCYGTNRAGQTGEKEYTIIVEE